MKRRPPLPRAELERSAVEEVRAIYRELDQRPIDRSCTRLAECCQFHLTGRTPQLTRGEALLASRALRATGRKSLPTPESGACPLLKPDGKCLIYQDRPFGCRTHFCAAAGGPYPRAQVLDLIRRLEVIDLTLDGDGPRNLSVTFLSELSS